MQNKIRVGVTMGDPAGIGPAICLKALNKLKGLADFTLIGDKWVFSRISGVKFIDLDNVPRRNFSFGKVRAEYGKASIEYLDKALELIKNKEIDCLVTAPISKEAINLAGFNFPGHTEYLAKYTNTTDYVMMLLNKDLKISLATRHIPLKSVPQKLKKGQLYKNMIIIIDSLKKLFLIKKPRIVACGLNPHASDNGVIGNEEGKVIRPVVEKVKAKLKMRIDGPLSADAAIYKTKQKKYDCAVAMYHDQALIPLKLYGNNTGVNMTLGLPFLRTSPLHGTAFDIAGKNLAKPDSLIAAIKLAIKCTLNLKRD